MAVIKKVLAVGAVVAFSFAVFAATQQPDSSSDSYMNGRPLKMQSEDKLTGKVKSVNRVQEPDGTKIHVVLETDSGDKTIIVGPAYYLDQAKIAFQNGEKVTISAYEVTVNGEKVWVATKVDKNGHVTVLRKNGVANWQTDHNGNSEVHQH